MYIASVAGFCSCACLYVCLCISRLFGIDIEWHATLRKIQEAGDSRDTATAGQPRQRPGESLGVDPEAVETTGIADHW